MDSNFLLINKPAGWTSFDVVAYVRKLVRNQLKQVGLPTEARRAKVGHAGTLDPFATGLLIVGIGREATKKLDEFKNLPKTYVATIKLGAVSDTFDKTGTIEEYELNIKQKLNKYLTKILQKINNQQVVSVNQDYQGIRKLLDKFIGKQHQLPPMFSAKKVKGKKLYELARKGITVKRKKNKIEIFSIKLLDFQYPILKIEVTCSAGTYIRTLANDIGEKLGCGGYCEELQRIRIGDYSLTDAVEVENLKF